MLKEIKPGEVTEYVQATDLQEDPAFAWWIPFMLKKWDQIIDTVNSRIMCKAHKLGIEIPTSVESVKDTNWRNGNTIWKDAIAKEIYNVKVSFKIL